MLHHELSRDDYDLTRISRLKSGLGMKFHRQQGAAAKKTTKFLMPDGVKHFCSLHGNIGDFV